MAATPRVTYAMAERGELPAWLGKVHRAFATPVSSILFFAALVAALAVSGSFVWLAVISTLARMIVYAATIIALPRAPNRPARISAFALGACRRRLARLRNRRRTGGNRCLAYAWRARSGRAAALPSDAQALSRRLASLRAHRGWEAGSEASIAGPRRSASSGPPPPRGTSGARRFSAAIPSRI